MRNVELLVNEIHSRLVIVKLVISLNFSFSCCRSGKTVGSFRSTRDWSSLLNS